MHLSVTSAFDRLGIKSSIAFVGHLGTHKPHTLHLLISILERFLSTFGASKGHTFTHIPQAIQPTSQFFLVSTPLSFEWQATSTCLDAGSTSMTFLGQAASHFLHPVHFVMSTKGR